MRDFEIRQQLMVHLKNEHAEELGTLIVDELGICDGANRADVAVVNGALSGFEIKSQFDTLLRFSSQIESYNQIFDYNFAVIDPKHLEEVQNLAPEWWGIFVVSESSFNQIRSAKINKNVHKYSLSQLLWKIEIIQALKEVGAGKGHQKMRIKQLREMLCASYGLDELQELVRQTLKEREGWRNERNSFKVPLIQTLDL